MTCGTLACWSTSRQDVAWCVSHLLCMLLLLLCMCSTCTSSPTFHLNSQHSWLARWRPFGTGVVAHVGGVCVSAVCVSLIVCLSVIFCLTVFLRTLSSFYYFPVIDSSPLCLCDFTMICNKHWPECCSVILGS